MIEVHGYTHPRFVAVRDAFAANFANTGDVGASFCATLKGEIVVDIWAGVADADDPCARRESVGGRHGIQRCAVQPVRHLACR